MYPAAKKHGGPGRFAKSGRAHLTESSSPDPLCAAPLLVEEWRPYWDTDRTYLVEKSPPNMIMGRWLQEGFAGSALIVILRHPVVVALSTKKWTRRTSLTNLVRHWFTAHDILEQDAPHLERLLVLRYEDLIAEPRATLDEVSSFIGLNEPLSDERLDGTRSTRYVESWGKMQHGSRRDRHRRGEIVASFGPSAERYGYDVHDLNANRPFCWPPAS